MSIISNFYRFVKMLGKWLKANLALILFGFLMLGIGVIAGGRFLQRPPIMITGDVVNLESLKKPEAGKITVTTKKVVTDFVASSRGKYYYPADCKLADNLSPANLLRFDSEEKAKEAGYIRQTKCD